MNIYSVEGNGHIALTQIDSKGNIKTSSMNSEEEIMVL